MWADAHCSNCLSGDDITLKTVQPFSKSLYELHLTLRSIYLQVKISLPENDLATSYSLQVTCALVQFNVNG